MGVWGRRDAEDERHERGSRVGESARGEEAGSITIRHDARMGTDYCPVGPNGGGDIEDEGTQQRLRCALPHGKRCIRQCTLVQVGQLDGSGFAGVAEGPSLTVARPSRTAGWPVQRPRHPGVHMHHPPVGRDSRARSSRRRMNAPPNASDKRRDEPAGGPSCRMALPSCRCYWAPGRRAAARLATLELRELGG